MDIVELAKSIVDIGFTGFLIILVLIGMRQYHTLLDRFLHHMEDYHVPKEDDDD